MAKTLGDYTVSDAKKEDLGSFLANLLSLPTRRINRVLKKTHGNTLLRTAFGESWAEGIGGLRSSVAREWGLAPEIAALTNKRAQGVSRSLNAAHGRILVKNLFEAEWPASATKPAARAASVPKAPPTTKAPLGYRVLETIQGGGMAEAFRGEHEATGDTVFMKRVRGSSQDARTLQREINIYERLDRAQATCMMPVRGVEHVDDWVYLITDHADGGDLRAYLERHQPLPHDKVQKIATQVATAIHALHSHSVVHRDIKPGNILLHKRKWHLTDFGISKSLVRLQTARTLRGHGTNGYAAPEQWNQVEANPSADVYGFGRILIDLAGVGTSPWSDLISQCTAANPDARPDMEAVLRTLKAIPRSARG